MNQCPKCKKTYDDIEKFCPDCGTSLAPVMPSAADSATPRFCHKCGNPLGEGMKFCASCGASLTPTVNGASSHPIGANTSSTAKGFAMQAASNDIYIPDKGIKEMFFRYDNRLNRKRFILRTLILFAICGLLDALLGGNLAEAHLHARSFVVIMLIPLASSMLSIRRLHDLNRSGYWYILMACVPFLSLYLFFAKGTDGPNQYGPDPLTAPGFV